MSSSTPLRRATPFHFSTIRLLLLVAPRVSECLGSSQERLWPQAGVISGMVCPSLRPAQCRTGGRLNHLNLTLGRAPWSQTGDPLRLTFRRECWAAKHSDIHSPEHRADRRSPLCRLLTHMWHSTGCATDWFSSAIVARKCSRAAGSY